MLQNSLNGVAPVSARPSDLPGQFSKSSNWMTHRTRGARCTKRHARRCWPMQTTTCCAFRMCPDQDELRARVDALKPAPARGRASALAAVW